MDLPKDAFLQWVGWVMSPHYLFDDTRLEAVENFPKYEGALRALCMDFLVKTVRGTVKPVGRRTEVAGGAASGEQQRRNQECRCAFHRVLRQ